MRKIIPVYNVEIVNGKPRRTRDQKHLRKSILKVLSAVTEGGMSLRSVTEAVSASDHLSLTALECLYASGDVQRFNAYNPKRCRTDEFWCIAGRSPVRQGNRFKGLETLQAFQIAARQAYGQGAGA